MKLLKLLKIVLCLSIFLVSCSGDDGAVGPQGEQGVQGDQGDQGNQGEAGTANVIYSDWIETNYVLAGAQQTNLQGLEVFSTSELNIDRDVVLVYGKRDVDGTVHGLPYLLSTQNEYYGYTLAEVTGGVGLQVRVFRTDVGTNLFTFFNDFRYVVIPGEESAGGRSASSYSQADYYAKLSYKEITALFNIPE